jgi:hypothetical protein
MARLKNSAESQGIRVDQLFPEYGLRAKLHELHRIVTLYQTGAMRCYLSSSISKPLLKRSSTADVTIEDGQILHETLKTTNKNQRYVHRNQQYNFAKNAL